MTNAAAPRAVEPETRLARVDVGEDAEVADEGRLRVGKGVGAHGPLAFLLIADHRR
ncbi:hypothetical protein ACIRPX_14610 [Streptomyces sp. NPDC101225]|uniref:hypothetical protein n=1 Tax=Streptomyces sp. NPDC101225 TaxID=3366135 RepID=UPI003805BFDB